VNPWFFPSFCGSAGIFCTGEVYSGIPELVCPYQEVLDSTLNYPIYFPLIRAFNSTDGTMWDLVNEINGMHAKCKVFGNARFCLKYSN
jgi:alpha-amylase